MRNGFALLIVATVGLTSQGAPALAQIAPNAKEEPVRVEKAPPDITLYLPIPLEIPNIDSPSTGVFVPKDYRASASVDLVLFLRGYDIKRPKSATAVAEYWNSPQHPVLKSFMFREEVNSSGKNAILVIPPLGPHSEFGNLKNEKGIREFFDQILEGLWKSGHHRTLAQRPTVRHLILAAHSGGGVPLRKLAEVLGQSDSYRDKLKGCWGFDSLYGVKDRDAEFWSAWAQKHPGTQVTMFYLFTDKEVGKDPSKPVGVGNAADRRVPTGTTFPATELDRLSSAMKLTNVIVKRDTIATTLNHNDVPRTHLSNLLKSAEYLDKR